MNEPDKAGKEAGRVACVVAELRGKRHTRSGRRGECGLYAALPALKKTAK
jgi:hypothetical protein